tara:strand:- start:37 stop:1602 length:1566 start_codon:yes stop_codon:yes gene_type:complete
MVPFPILGLKTAPMIGRSAIMRQLKSNYVKDSPSHLSIVGPRFSGKSVLLNALAEGMRQDRSSQFRVIAFLDLGHQTPMTDKDFLGTMCKEIGSKLQSLNQEMCADTLLQSDDPYNDLREVVDILEDEKIRILMLWDGFDKPLGSGKLTRNLWDQLRALAESKGLTLITATRKPLHELIRDEESATSDFWNIFDANPVWIPPFAEDDQNAVLDKLDNMGFESGAKTELANWTGGFPPLYLSVINQLLTMSLSEVDGVAVKEAAKTALVDNASGILGDLWNDCSQSTKDLFLDLIKRKEIPTAKTQKKERTQLFEKGFAKLSRNKVIKSCRLMEDYVLDKEQDTGNVARRFKSYDDYQKNIRPVLEHRLNQIKNIDDRLKSLIARSIEDIPNHPDACLLSMQGITERAFEVIWNIEFPEKREIPPDWITEWQYCGKNFYTSETFPSTPVEQLRLLQCMTGAHQRLKGPPKAKYANKVSYNLLNNIWNFRTYGNHHEGEEVPLGAAVTAVMTCVELAASLDME